MAGIHRKTSRRHRPRARACMGLAVITGRFLLRFLLVLQETLSFGECRRRLLRDYFAVAMGAEEGEGGRSARALAGSIARFFPRRKLLRTIAMRAFPGPISRRVSNISAMQAVYNGSGIRIDGNFKLLKNIGADGTEEAIALQLRLGGLRHRRLPARTGHARSRRRLPGPGAFRK